MEYSYSITLESVEVVAEKILKGDSLDSFPAPYGDMALGLIADFQKWDQESWKSKRDSGRLIRCKACGDVSPFHYGISEEEWRTIVPECLQSSSICLPCLLEFSAMSKVPFGLDVNTPGLKRGMRPDFIHGDVEILGGHTLIAFNVSECSHNSMHFSDPV